MVEQQTAHTAASQAERGQGLRELLSRAARRVPIPGLKALVRSRAAAVRNRAAEETSSEGQFIPTTDPLAQLHLLRDRNSNASISLATKYQKPDMKALIHAAGMTTAHDSRKDK